MNPTDKKPFQDLMNAVSEAYSQRQKPSVDLLRMYFTALENYPLDQVRAALDAHMRDTQRGQFFPKIADVMFQLEGSGEYSPEKVIAMARANSTPLGALLRLEITQWDLDNLKPFDLRQRAIEALEELPGMIERARQGRYTPHELCVLAKYKIDPLGPIAPGLPAPTDPALPGRLAKAIEGPTMARLIAPTHPEGETGVETGPEAARAARERLSAMMAELGDREEDSEA